MGAAGSLCGQVGHKGEKMTSRRLLLSLSTLCVVLFLLTGLGLGPVLMSAMPRQTWTFQGKVFEGTVGDETMPIPDVVVSLYGSDAAYPDSGTLLDVANTDGDGWYSLTGGAGFAYYHIRETDPGWLVSIGATSVSGTVWNSNWIEHAAPLDGKDLTGNKFWDSPPEPYFGDNFDDGNAEGWDLVGGWSVVSEGGNFVLQGSGEGWAEPLVEGWASYEWRADVRLDAGSVDLSFRVRHGVVDETEWELKRYSLILEENYLYLRKQIGSEFYNLHEAPIAFPLGVWHAVQVRVEGPLIQVLIDGALATRFTDTVYVIDPSKPVLFGKIALETLPGSVVFLDNLLIIGGPLIPIEPGYRWWRTGGASGGLGYDVRIHPTDNKIMYVTDNPSGVNKSTDAGRTWVQRNNQIDARTGDSMDEIPIFSLTMDPSDPSTLWAGTQNVKGVYRSTDGGASWDKLIKGITEGNEISFRNFGIHPTNSNIVFGGAEIKTFVTGQEFDKAKGKIYKSTDGGQNWYPVWGGGSLVRFVLFDYNNPQTMYASTGIFDREAYSDTASQPGGVGLLKSTDGGDTWFPINQGIPQQEGNRFLGFLDMHPTNPQILMAAAGNNVWGNGGVFRTTNGGDSWSKVSTHKDIYTVVVFSPSNPDVVYAGSGAAFYRSDDGGDTWQRFQKAGENQWGPLGVRAGVPIGAVVDPDDPMTVFVNNYQGGNFLSTDGGETWVNASKGYTGAKLSDIAVAPSHAGIVFVNGRSGPFRSLDGGVNWDGLSYSPASQPEWNAVAINPNNTNEILLSDEFQGFIFKSTDRGKSWRKVFDEPNAGDDCSLTPPAQMCRDGFQDIAYAPSNPSIIYAGMRASRRNIDHDFPARKSYGMYKSTDGGENWFAINNGLNTTYINIHAVAVHPGDANTAYAGTWKDGLYKTTDGGSSWVAKNVGLAASDVRAVAIDPNNPQTLYAGLGEGAGIYKSTNGGDSWGAINTGIDLICPSYLLPAGGSELGFSLEGPPEEPLGQIYSSVPWTSIRAIVIDPTSSQTVYAADHNSGIYLSTNGGSSWSKINDGLTMRAVRALAISSDGQVVYAASWGGGVFRLGDVDVEQIYLPLIVK